MNPGILLAALFAASLAIALAYNVVSRHVELRAEAERRREEGYRELVGASLKAMNTAREEILLAWEQERKHLETVLEDFLSRSFEERQMGRMIGNEVRLDQETDTLDIDEDDREGVIAAAAEERTAAGNGQVAEGVRDLEGRMRSARGGLEPAATGPEAD